LTFSLFHETIGSLADSYSNMDSRHPIIRPYDVVSVAMCLAAEEHSLALSRRTTMFADLVRLTAFLQCHHLFEPTRNRLGFRVAIIQWIDPNWNQSTAALSDDVKHSLQCSEAVRRGFTSRAKLASNHGRTRSTLDHSLSPIIICGIHHQSFSHYPIRTFSLWRNLERLTCTMPADERPSIFKRPVSMFLRNFSSKEVSVVDSQIPHHKEVSLRIQLNGHVSM
jgi:hypothetical protein